MTTTAPPVTARRHRVSWIAVVLTSAAVVLFAVTPYLTTALGAQTDGLGAAYADRPLAVRAAFYVHVVAGGLALLVGPWQFSTALRRRRPRVHRVTGRVAVLAIAAAGVCGLVLAPFNSAGLVGTVGFGTLAVLWLATTWRALRAIRRGDVRAHRAWMYRSFALTYAAVTLRLWTVVLVGLEVAVAGVGPERAFEDVYALVPFWCWLPNLVVAELLVRRRGLPSLRIVDPARPPARPGLSQAVQAAPVVPA
jgi:uncharacterized membrane protein